MYECSGVCLCIACGSHVLSLCKYTKYAGNQHIVENVYVAQTVPVQLAPLIVGLWQGFIEGVYAETKLLTSWLGRERVKEEE